MEAFYTEGEVVKTRVISLLFIAAMLSACDDSKPKQEAPAQATAPAQKIDVFEKVPYPVDKYPEEGKVATFIGMGSEVETYPGLYTIDPHDASFMIPDAQKSATPEFLECIDNGKYKGKIAITAMIQGMPENNPDLKIDKTSKCERR